MKMAISISHVFKGAIAMKTVHLLGSASLLAISAVPVTAQDGTDTSFAPSNQLSLRGGYGMLNNASADKIAASGGPEAIADYTDKFGDPNTDVSYMGAVSLKRQVTPTRDFSFGISAGGSPSNARAFMDKGGSGYCSGIDYCEAGTGNRLTFGAIDAEMGLSTPNGLFRGFAGIRAANTSAAFAMDKYGADYSGYYSGIDLEIQSDFVGIGPRVGVGFDTYQPGQRFGFVGQVGYANLYGQRRDLVTGEAYFGYEGDYEDSYPINEDDQGPKTVGSLDALLGIEFYLDQNSKVSAGLQAQQFWNIDLWSDSEGPFDSQPRLTSGAYIGYSTSF
jgi:hypothetical protein